MNSSDCATARGKVGSQVSWSVPSPDAVRHVVGSVILWPASQEVKSISHSTAQNLLGGFGLVEHI